jgi:hypothetical protein
MSKVTYKEEVRVLRSKVEKYLSEIEYSNDEHKVLDIATQCQECVLEMALAKRAYLLEEEKEKWKRK